MNIISLISAFGLGAIVTSLIQAWLSDRARISNRNFQEKRESYPGFLEALRRSQVEGTEESAVNVGHWASRIDLVGSKAVIRACARISETNPTQDGIHPERPDAMRDLKEAMRQDLGVAN
jgi:hypothetical protein